jgi:hypothetical protein
VRAAVHLTSLGDDVHTANDDGRLDGKRDTEDVELLGELKSELPKV